MQELQRRVASGKAFGNRVELITPAQVKARFPLLEENMIQGALWDPDAGLVRDWQIVQGEGCRLPRQSGAPHMAFREREQHGAMLWTLTTKVRESLVRASRIPSRQASR